MLEVHRLTKSYPRADGEVRALDDVSLTVDAGEFVVIEGPSGCGKTTLLLAAGGLLAPDGGRIVVVGQDIYEMTPNARARVRAETIGFVFQQFHLVPYLTVLENVLVPALGTGSARQKKDRAIELIRQFNLEHRADHVPADLSTGERQRTALARAMLNGPRLLLADEPTGNLDRENGQVVLRSLAEFARTGGAVLLVTHDQVPPEFDHRTLRLCEGRILPLRPKGSCP